MADSAGRLDSYVSTNKAMGIGFQRKGGGTATPKIYTNIIEYSAFAEYSEVTPICVRSLFMCHLGPLWFLSSDAERNVKKKLKSIKISVFLKY